ncbi:MAG: LamG domain-containing protein, partial [Planctomycetota bacterium]
GYRLEIQQVYESNPWVGFAVELEGQGLCGLSMGAPMLTENTWYFAAGVYDGSALTVYVGKSGEPLVAMSEDYSGSIVPSSNHLNIGRDPSNTGRFFEGLIDDVQVHRRALSAAEIGKMYAMGLAGHSYGPLFADANNADYHLLSDRGRYWPEHDVWVLDDVTSPCVDAGDPAIEPLNERMPNGGLVNIGAFGNTAYASMSEWTIVGDLDRSGRVDLRDFAIWTQDWLEEFEWAGN